MQEICLECKGEHRFGIKDKASNCCSNKNEKQLSILLNYAEDISVTLGPDKRDK